MSGEARSAAATTAIVAPGVRVDRVHRPADVESLCAVVADHRARGEGLLVCGGRTRIGEANPARGVVAALSLEALAGVDVFEPEEGVVHARAGTPIRLLRDTVAAEGWELPLDPPGETATVGGTLASAAVGPRGHVFGRVADAVLGIEVVDGTGTASKSGGRVVKNVTGYDLAKLYTGSFGSLAVVTGAWLRLRPQPARRLILAGRVARDGATFERARACARAASVRAFVWREEPGATEAELTVELGASEAAVAHDRDALVAALALAQVEAGGAVIDRLRDVRAQARAEAALGLRIRVQPTRLDAMREATLAAGLAVSIDLGVAAITARCRPGPADGRLDDLVAGGAATLARLREQAEGAGGVLRCEWLPPASEGALDVFGEEAGTRSLMSSLKQRFDPRGVLNPGRFVAGT
ncbi:MAG: FAD-binding oxidoreductase [Myxococcota bacterium]